MQPFLEQTLNKNISPLGTGHRAPTSKFLNITFGEGFFLEIDSVYKI